MTTTLRSLFVASVLHLSRSFKAVLLPLFFILGLASSPLAHSNTLGLVISTDNANEVYLNGVLLGTANDWAQSKSYSAALQSGSNVLAVKGIDAGGVAALIAELTLPAGKVVSSATWKVSTTAASGWEALGYNDSAWPAATQYGQYGVAPWFKNVTGFPSSSTANWIWTADSENDDTAYFRYTFSVGSAPLAVSTTTLPNGVQRAAYMQTLAATGGTPPYSWSVVTGSLPAGLNLNAATGVVSGTPSGASGTSNFTVRVTDANSATAERALALTVTKLPANALPSVSMTGPADGSSYTAPASITLSANASDSDGSIAAVEFYNGTSLIGSTPTAPYAITWSNIPVGNYSVRARAVDNQGGATYSNTIAVNVIVPPPPASASLYYLYADHLNTPRVATDSTNKVVWRWDSDAFGTSTANEDPDGDGVKFTYNPRFPGQYFDKETGLHYNYFRDYEPGTGRYVQSDPIGLRGGLNTYGYVGGNPVSYTDPLGLAQIGSRPLEGWLPGNGSGLLRHDQIWYDDKQSPDNSGFFDDDSIRADRGHTRDEFDFSRDPRIYDDSLMREAEKNIRKNWDMDWRLLRNDCQDYGDAARREYNRLLQQRKRFGTGRR